MAKSILRASYSPFTARTARDMMLLQADVETKPNGDKAWLPNLKSSQNAIFSFTRDIPRGLNYSVLLIAELMELLCKQGIKPVILSPWGLSQRRHHSM